jgi:transposase
MFVRMPALREKYDSVVPDSVISQPFAMKKATVHSHCESHKRRQNEDGTSGRPSILSRDLHAELIQKIEEADTVGRAWTMTEIMQFLQ